MVLGITGISGSGKHTVADFFRKKGWVILDVDKIAHELYRPYTGVWKKIAREFGDNILNHDDTINRGKLAEIVFNHLDPDGSDEALKKLNSIIHPYVKRRLKDELYHHSKRESNIAVVVALWEELDLEGICDKVLLLKTDYEIRAKRIQKRDGISDNMYKMRVKNQKEPSVPDFVIENNGEMQALNIKLNAIFPK